MKRDGSESFVRLIRKHQTKRCRREDACSVFEFGKEIPFKEKSHRGTMMFWAIFFLHGAQVTGLQPNASVGSPENITVQVIDAKTVQVFWSSVRSNVERFDVTYNPTEDKIVSQAAGNSQSIVLRELRPDTQYQVTITAVIGGKNYKSRRIVFRTAADQSVNSEIYPTQASYDGKGTMPSTKYVTVDPTAKYMPQTSSTVRGVELGLVLLALVVWIVAIALFFHRWGKIRMLLPYQPDYKTQQALKVPGTGTTLGTSCSGNGGTEGQQEGAGCLQHMRWSSNCSDERPTAKKWRRAQRSPLARDSSPYFIREDYGYCESPEIVTHSYRQKNSSAESIALCQLKDSPEKKMVTVKVHANKPETKDKRRENIVFVNNLDPVTEHKQRKNASSLDNISDSIQSLLGCTSAFCQKKNLNHDKRKYGRDVTKYELEPLFFVGNRELYSEDVSDTKILVHECAKNAENEKIPEDTLPEVQRSKRYSRSSFKKQKVSLYNENELDLYMKVPIMENQPSKKDKATETEKPKSSSSSSRDTADMKRKAFLRKISLQDTYLNYNQDYWLDYKKSVRFHKSIDLGYFGNEDKKPETPGEKPKPKLTETITEKSSEVIDEGEVHCDSRALPERSAVMADFRKASGGGAAKSFFLLPSSENIPLFCERNGNIETDFDVFGDVPEEECLLIEKSDAAVTPAREHRPESENNEHCMPQVHYVNSMYDFSQFYEVKLDTGLEPVKRSTVFNFQGGHAFFGENLNSTSDDSDVFYNENEVPERTSYPEQILFPEKSRNSGMV